MEVRVITKLVLVNDKGEILLIRRSPTDTRRPGQWDMPGGMVDPGEDIMQAVVRETQEEAGVDVAPDRLKLLYATSKFKPDFGALTWIFFATRVDDTPEVTLSYEHDDLQWLTPEAALHVIEYDLHQELLTYITTNKLLDLV